MECNKEIGLLRLLRSNKFLQKALVLFCGITAVVCMLFLVRIAHSSNNTDVNDRDSSRHNKTKQFRTFPSHEPVGDFRRNDRKIFIAFDYWEQLTMATNNFFHLTALAAYGGRQVVIPFVKDSKFYGSPTKDRLETLALYFNVTALNHTLRSRGHGTLISWEEFQDVCQGRLDVLVYFNYRKDFEVTRPFFPCNDRWNHAIGDFKVNRTIGMNVFAVDKVEIFENEVVKRLPCVGLAEWRGSLLDPNRAQFNLSTVVTHLLIAVDPTISFSSRLLYIAQDFITKNLGTSFFSMHIRTEKILKLKQTIRDMTALKTCIANLMTLVQQHKNDSTAHIPVFLAADFSNFGSFSARVKPARETAESLMKILAPLNPVLFQPSAYNLTDRGAVAIVEMNILASGKHLFVVGGGSFQSRVINQFLHNKNIDRSSIAKCNSELCYRLCCF